MFKKKKKHRHKRRHRHSSSSLDLVSLTDLEPKAPLPEEAFGAHASAVQHGGANSNSTSQSNILPDYTLSPSDSVHHSHHHRHRRKKHRKKRIAQRVAIGVGVTVLAVLLVGFGLVAASVHKINTELALPAQEVDDLKKVLVDDSTSASEKNSNAYYVLLVGLDSRSATEYTDVDEGRTDIILLVRVDPDNGILTLVTVPRDTPWQGKDGRIYKINAALNQGGPAATVQAVNNLTGISISHYVEVNFVGFEDMIDAIGGITVNVPYELTMAAPDTGQPYVLQPGTQLLNGREARVLAQNRLQYTGYQDAKRQDAVRQVVLGLIQAAKDTPVQELPEFVQAIAGFVGTDLKVNDMVAMAPGATKCTTIYQVSGPYEGDINPHVNDWWLCYENPQGWARLMELVDAGKDPSGISYVNDSVQIAGEPRG